jgi:hypothetical protein
MGRDEMKLVYIHQHFVTNEGTAGTRSYDVSKYMIAAGHEVTMVCGVYWQGSFKPMPWWRLWRVEWIDGIRVIVCNVYYANHHRPLLRMWRFLKFALLATLVTVKERGADVIFATSTPLTVGIPARIAAALKHIPMSSRCATSGRRTCLPRDGCGPDSSTAVGKTLRHSPTSGRNAFCSYPRASTIACWNGACLPTG